MTDFWPTDLGALAMRTPLSILREQASALGSKTQQLLKGEIDSTTTGDQFTHTLSVVAPALNMYRYELLKVWHDIFLYPLRARYQSGTTTQLANEEQFVEWLRVNLSSAATKKVLDALLVNLKK